MWGTKMPYWRAAAHTQGAHERDGESKGKAEGQGGGSHTFLNWSASMDSQASTMDRAASVLSDSFRSRLPSTHTTRTPSADPSDPAFPTCPSSPAHTDPTPPEASSDSLRRMASASRLVYPSPRAPLPQSRSMDGGATTSPDPPAPTTHTAAHSAPCSSSQPSEPTGAAAPLPGTAHSPPTPHAAPAPCTSSPDTPPAGEVAPGVPFVVGQDYPVVLNKVFFRVTDEPGPAEGGVVGGDGRVVLQIDSLYEYFPFCADFGPFNIAVVWRFSELMLTQIKAHHTKRKAVFVLQCTSKPQTVTNVATLIAAWLILDLNWTVERAWQPFNFTENSPYTPFRDATFTREFFPLHPEDVLRGLFRAKACGLLSLDTLDIDMYEYADHPLAADLHEVVPGRFVAFRGPKHKKVVDLRRGIIHLAPADYLPLLLEFNVRTVVRLNNQEYEESAFMDEGINTVELYFDDCSTPSATVLRGWFKLCRVTQGSMAVHCKAGLGRTGTLIAVWLMRKHMFTAREVIGYLRVMRPGSVLGAQQEWLACKEETLWDMGDPDFFEESPLELKRLARDSSDPTRRANGAGPASQSSGASEAARAERERKREALAHENTLALERNTADRLRSGRAGRSRSERGEVVFL